MAKRLTEEMVIARTKISDLSKIKRLNCWGSELVDVSLLRRMPSVEVLSLRFDLNSSTRGGNVTTVIVEGDDDDNDDEEEEEEEDCANYVEAEDDDHNEEWEQIDRRQRKQIKTERPINKINSLEDFSQCKRLEELYIRQNDIHDINQVVYLQGLQNLKNLWLGENPCANVDGYRYSVLRTLPQLQKLDNVAVSPEELRDAQRKGRQLSHPDDPQESEEETAYVPNHQYRYADETPPQQPEYSPQRNPPKPEPEFENEDEQEFLNQNKDSSPPPPIQELIDVVEQQGSDYSSPPRQMSPPRRSATQADVMRRYSPEPQEYVEPRRRSSYDPLSPKHQPPQQFYERTTNNQDEVVPPTENNFKEPRLVTSQSTNNIKEYTNGERYNRNVYRDEGSEVSFRHEGPVRSASQHNCSVAHRPPFQRRPVTRNSNILSAVLCLVKELDYPSLEVVEMAVRCRMDELDE